MVTAKLAEVVIATIMRKVLEALAYVHKQGDIHRWGLHSCWCLGCAVTRAVQCAVSPVSCTRT
jgi:hypothetical protein